MKPIIETHHLQKRFRQVAAVDGLNLVAPEGAVTAECGEPRAAEELLPFVYEELRRLARQKMAKEQPGQTLQPHRSDQRCNPRSIVARQP